MRDDALGTLGQMRVARSTVKNNNYNKSRIQLILYCANEAE
jgi:hypothetical protein